MRWRIVKPGHIELPALQPIQDVRMPEKKHISPTHGLCSTLAAAVLLTMFGGAGPAPAQTPSDRVIEAFTCKDVMREPNTSREVAIAFLHGYLLGKSGGSKFNVEVLEQQTNAFIEQCLDSPQSKAVDVMTKLKG